MFRLVRILNSRTNTPEIEHFTHKGCYVPIEDGCALERIEATLTTATTQPEFIAVNNVKSGDNNDILAYRITPEMIFKVDYIDTSPAEVGRNVAVAKVGMVGKAVKMDDDGIGRIIKICDNPKYVYVKFDVRLPGCEC